MGSGEAVRVLKLTSIELQESEQMEERVTEGQGDGGVRALGS